MYLLLPELAPSCNSQTNCKRQGWDCIRWCQFSMTGVFTTVTEECYLCFEIQLASITEMPEECKGKRQRTPSKAAHLYPAFQESTSLWKVLNKPPWQLMGFTLTKCKLYEASSGSENSDPIMFCSREVSMLCLFSTRRDAVYLSRPRVQHHLL